MNKGHWLNDTDSGKPWFDLWSAKWHCDMLLPPHYGLAPSLTF